MKAGTRNQKELAELLRPLFLRSAKFRAWKRPVPHYRMSRVPAEIKGHTDGHAITKHYTPTELAEKWGVSAETVRSIFRAEPDVLKIKKPGTNSKRAYVTLRIPLAVAERVHRRLSAVQQ
jgi:hypothetical protein